MPHRICKPLAIAAILIAALPMNAAFAGGKQAQREGCSQVKWTVNGDGTRTKLRVQGCVKVNGYIFGSNTEFDGRFEGDNLRIHAFPGACSRPKPVAVKGNDRDHTVIPRCNP